MDAKEKAKLLYEVTDGDKMHARILIKESMFYSKWEREFCFKVIDELEKL